MGNSFEFKSNFAKRILATLIDYAICYAFCYLYVIYIGDDDGRGGKSVNGLLALVVLLIWFAYFVIVEAMYGATLAHKVLGLKVLTLKRNEIEFKHAFKRRLLDIIDIYFYGIPALIAIKHSSTHQRLGDMWAGTIVVDTKDPEQFLKVQDEANG
ncbi:MAG: RDD family protein [Tenuifilaceae bacterium]|jgi:uncharacterized RDD family membrane protein YckC|nr:RDD family protein [Tenuifilaceae bacterium]